MLVDRAHVTVVDPEDPGEAVRVVKQPRPGARAVVAAFRTEVGELERLGLRPGRIVPAVLEPRAGVGGADARLHQPQ